MATSRREKIEAMLADEPADAFLRYGLAMELAKEGDLKGSLAHLEDLMHLQPPYVGAFFLAGRQLAEQGSTTEARSVLRDGIEAVYAEAPFRE